jgi:hypothetical protein
MAEKTYINGIFIKKIQTSFGDILKCSVKAESFIEEIKKHTNEKGYVNFDLMQRKESDKQGNTHYAVLNTYVKEETDNSTILAANQQRSVEESWVTETKYNDDLPF